MKKLNKAYNVFFKKALRAKGPKQKAKLVQSYRKHLLRAAQGGDPEAQYDLSLALDQSWTFANNQKESMRWLKMAVGQCHPDALNSLGSRFDQGRGVSKSHRKAAGLYRQSMCKGNALGAYNLAKCFELGTGVRKDLKRALLLFHFSLELGFQEAKKDIRRLGKR